MTPIKTKNTNGILKGTSKDVVDLPITRFRYADGTPAVESCWKLSKEELEEINKTGVIFLKCFGHTHAPILLSTKSAIEED